MATQDNLTYGFDKPTAEVLRNKASESTQDGNRFVPLALAYFWPPIGGIPAATTTTASLLVGAAQCYKAIRTDFGNYTKGSDLYRVENMVPATVGANGKPIGCVRNEYGNWTVIVEDCTPATTTTVGLSTLDPVGGGTTTGVDVGLGIGV